MLEKMYEDFTSKVLPVFQEGLVITKDYFFDLFGRYVKYLLVTDAVTLVLLIIVLILICFAAYKTNQYGIKASGFSDWTNYFDKVWPALAMFAFVFGAIITIAGIDTYFRNVFKDIFIPEVRIYEEIQNFKK